jgi:hypothetical protein
MEMLSNGILDIDETEGEEISLTAEGPQLTEEERLRIESEKEEGDDEDVKRIDLFTSEDGEADPLNKLLMAEDGISTLFMKKGGRVPLKDGTDKPAIQGGGPNYLGKQPEVKVPKYWKSSPDHPDTELAYITEPEKQVLIALNMHGGLEDGKPNTGPNGIISLQGDMGSVGGSSSGTGGDGNTNRERGIQDYHSRVSDMAKENQRQEELKNLIETGPGSDPEKYDTDEQRQQDKYSGTTIGRIKKGQDIVNTALDRYNVEKNKFDEKYQKKVRNKIIGAVLGQGMTLGLTDVIGGIIDGMKVAGAKNDLLDSIQTEIGNLKDLGIPDFTPHTDTPIQTLEQLELDLTQKDKDEDDERDDSTPPIIEQIMASNQVIENRDETDIFNIWDQIKDKQAQRAMLVEKGIIQDNTQDQTMALNSGGLANLFRVKTQ